MSTVSKILSLRYFGTIVAFAAIIVAGCAGPAPLGVSYTLPTVPTTGVTVTSVNSQNVAQDALASSVGAANAGYGGPGGVATAPTTKKTVKLHLDDAIRVASRIVIDRLNAEPMPAGVSQTYACSDYYGVVAYQGSIKVTQEGNDARIDYNNCGDPTVVVIDGAIAATNISYTGNPPSPPFTLGVTYSYNLSFTYNSGAETVAMMGRFDVDINDTGSSLSTAITNGEMGIVAGGEALVMTNINNTQSCSSYSSLTLECTGTVTISNNYTIGGTLSNGTFTVTTTTPLQIRVGAGAEYPYTGVIEVNGSNNSFLSITIHDDEMTFTGATSDLTVDMDPDTTTTGGETSTDYDWSTIFV